MAALIKQQDGRLAQPAATHGFSTFVRVRVIQNSWSSSAASPLSG
jgi:hypothetical protein